jgi:hypothetical protein
VRRLVLACALVIGACASAHADTPAPVQAPAHLRTREGTRLCAYARESDAAENAAGVRCRELPPGRFLAEPTWVRLDDEVRRLQDAEVRLTAANASLRKDAAGWRPGWKSLASAVLVGVALGAWAAR